MPTDMYRLPDGLIPYLRHGMPKLHPMPRVESVVLAGPIDIDFLQRQFICQGVLENARR
jgi:hypothetical protein